MLKAIFKDKTELILNELSKDGTKGKLAEKDFNYDVVQVSENRWHVINEKGESFSVSLESYNSENKHYGLKIDGQEIEVGLLTEFDLLLKDLGISAQGSKKIKEIKAPMPGLVIDVHVKPGDLVKEGETVLVLEAMKMENVIKASTDVKVKKVNVKNGDTIEKGFVMVSFE